MTEVKNNFNVIKEIRSIEQQLFGKAVIVTGIFAALLFLASCGNECTIRLILQK